MNTIRNIPAALRLLVAGLLCGSATLSQAQLTEQLYATPPNPARDNYSGVVGCQFTVGSTNVIVSHLGFPAANTNLGLNTSHYVGVFTSSLTAPVLLGQVTVPAGLNAYLTNGFLWVALNPPLLLAANTAYNLGSVVSNADGDSWNDLSAPTWNTWFVGSTPPSSRFAMYGSGYAAGTPIPWPPTAGFNKNTTNSTYGNVGLAYIQVGPAYVGVQQTNVTSSAGQPLTVNGFASGQLPITYQWYLASGAPVSGQTSATLVIPNASTNNSGTYYLTATNSLGGEQSSNVVVSVTAFPVAITQQPANTNVYQNYTATFSIIATGTPPIAYQWSRDGVAIPGATASTYSLVAGLANNGDIYSCLASNFINSTAETTLSSNATLTVTANLAQPQEFLHGARPSGLSTNNYTGSVGGVFETGNSPVLVTHLGYYATQFDSTGTNASLSVSHNVAIFSGDGTTVIGSVDLAAGTYPVINGYLWTNLTPPVVLSNNTPYLLAAETFSGKDPWGDFYTVPDFNPYFTTIGNTTSSRFAFIPGSLYGGVSFPAAPLSGDSGGAFYSAPNLAILVPPTPAAYVQPTNVTQYVGLSAPLIATVDGQAPLTLQWYEEPGLPLAGQTNLTLNLANLTLGQSGSYYVIATNAVTHASAQSADAIVTVIPDVGPSLTLDIGPTNAFIYQIAQFTAVVTGTPPFTYQWTFDGNAIPGATNAVLTLTDVSAASAGSYQLFVTNSFGRTNSSVGTLQVITPAWGGYASGVMSTNLLVYYRFSDASNYYWNGLIIATNQGSLGFTCDGTYQGIGTVAPGPTNILDLDETTNLAVSMDGLTADVLVPPLDNLVVSNCTIAAWVNDSYNPQIANAGIYFYRQTAVFGLSVNPSTVNSNADQLRVTWGGNFYDSNLQLPTNQWAFAAMVVSPTNIAVYLQNGTGMQTTNIASANAASALTGNSYIGWDTAGGTALRRWNGAIDEFMILNTALSAQAVNALYLGVPGSATLSIARSGANLVVTWPAWPGGTLQQAPAVTGPWTPTPGATNGSYTLTPSGPAQFYRVALQ